MQTIKDLAFSLGVTPQTIRNEIKRQGIIWQKNSDFAGGIGFCITDDEASRVKQAIESRKGQNAPSKTKVKAKQNPVKQRKNAYNDLLLQLDEKQKQIDALQAKLDAKDAELSNLMKTYTEQIQSLTMSIEKMTENMKAAQVLHAETIQNRIEHHPEKRWWQFWK